MAINPKLDVGQAEVVDRARLAALRDRRCLELQHGRSDLGETRGHANSAAVPNGAGVAFVPVLWIPAHELAKLESLHLGPVALEAAEAFAEERRARRVGWNVLVG